MDLREELRKYLDDNDLPATQVAREIDLSPATISSWMSGTYKGRVERIDTAVESYLIRKAGGPTKHTDRVVQTSVRSRLCGMAQTCHTQGSMGLAIGVAGIGKTLACRHYRDSNPGVILLEIDFGFTAWAMMSELHKAVGFDGSGGMHRQMLDIVERLKGSNRLIIIDEAEHLPYRALEMIRRVYDHTGVGVLLVGLRKLFEGIWGLRGQYSQFQSRCTAGVIKLDNITLPDARRIASSCLSESVSDDIVQCLYTTVKGNARSFRALITKTLTNADGNAAAIDVDLIKESATILCLQ